jgi:hypothetical protein
MAAISRLGRRLAGSDQRNLFDQVEPFFRGLALVADSGDLLALRRSLRRRRLG